jgi:hypothetical protein
MARVTGPQPKGGGGSLLLSAATLDSKACFSTSPDAGSHGGRGSGAKVLLRRAAKERWGLLTVRAVVGWRAGAGLGSLRDGFLPSVPHSHPRVQCLGSAMPSIYGYIRGEGEEGGWVQCLGSAMPPPRESCATIRPLAADSDSARVEGGSWGTGVRAPWASG